MEQNYEGTFNVIIIIAIIIEYSKKNYSAVFEIHFTLLIVKYSEHLSCVVHSVKET